MDLELELEERDFPLYWPADYSQSAARNVKVLRASDFTGVERGGRGGRSRPCSRHGDSSREASAH